MLTKLKRIISILVVLLLSGSLVAQSVPADEESPWSVGADLTSRYIWRGINLGGSSPSIQPGIAYNFGSTDHSFEVGAWGAYSISGVQTGQEADLFVSYTLKEMLSVTVTDYFFPDETAGSFDYLNYKSGHTGHVLESAVGFAGTDKIPISIMFAMNFYGDDAAKYEEQAGAMVATDGIAMSKYLELGYSTEVKGIGLDVFAGACLDNPDIDKGEPTGFYGQENAGLINLGMTLSKEIPVTAQYSMPVFGSIIVNPEAGNFFLVFGISF